MFFPVLTGTPGAGKTVILRALELDGFPVVEEAATDVIALRHALGDDEPWRDPGFVDTIVRLQRLRRRSGAIYDRSAVCTLALCRHLGFEPSRLLLDEVADVVRERPTVFFVRNLGFMHPTAERRITLEDALVFERLHEQTYRELGIPLVDVPAAPLDQRLALVRHVLGPPPVRAAR